MQSSGPRIRSRCGSPSIASTRSTPTSAPASTRTRPSATRVIAVCGASRSLTDAPRGRSGRGRRAGEPRRRGRHSMRLTPDELRVGRRGSCCASRRATSPARDLLEGTVALIAAMAPTCCRVASTLIEPGDALAVIGMGKLGGRRAQLRERHRRDVRRRRRRRRRSSARAPARLLEPSRGSCFRVDANLRPKGRDGPLVRTLDSLRGVLGRWAAAVGVPGADQGARRRRRRATSAQRFDRPPRHRSWGHDRSTPTTCGRCGR